MSNPSTQASNSAFAYDHASRFGPCVGLAFIGLGSNLGAGGTTPAELVRQASVALGALGHVTARSRSWSSPAWPDARRPRYVNAAARLQTDMGPEELLTALHDLEASWGRTRTARWADRTLDLDLLDYCGMVRAAQDDSALALPHPRLHTRAFVLLPLREIAPEWRHPATGRSITALIDALPTESVAETHPIPPNSG